MSSTRTGVFSSESCHGKKNVDLWVETHKKYFFFFKILEARTSVPNEHWFAPYKATPLLGGGHLSLCCLWVTSVFAIVIPFFPGCPSITL